MDPAEIPLRDIHLPDPVSWWPLAPGWWIAASVLIVLLVIAALLWFRHRRLRVRRAAMRELAAIESRYREHADTHRLARDLSQLARRTALAVAPDQTTVAATGEAWSECLDAMNESGTTDELIKTALTRAPYRPGEDFDGDAVLAAFRPWLAGLRLPPATSK